MSKSSMSKHAKPAAKQGGSAKERGAVPPDDADGELGRDDGPLDSLGKAITAPVWGAAEEDEKALGNKP